jgi:branched-chain amino acid transport system permease protein
MSLGLNIVVGLAGLLDLGYVAFYAVGAYSYALIAQNFGLSFWICLPLAGILAAFWGVLLGFPVLRLRGDYLAIVTLAFGEIIRLVIINWQSLTGGPNGVTGIPRPTFFGIPLTAGDDGLAAMLGIEFSPINFSDILVARGLYALRLNCLPSSATKAWGEISTGEPRSATVNSESLRNSSR